MADVAWPALVAAVGTGDVLLYAAGFDASPLPSLLARVRDARLHVRAARSCKLALDEAATSPSATAVYQPPLQCPKFDSVPCSDIPIAFSTEWPPTQTCWTWALWRGVGGGCLHTALRLLPVTQF